MHFLSALICGIVLFDYAVSLDMGEPIVIYLVAGACRPSLGMVLSDDGDADGKSYALAD